MSPIAVKRLAGGMVGLAVALCVASLVISMIDGNRANPRDAIIWVIMLVFSVGGYVITTRQSGNAIGWIFLGVGLSAGAARLTGAYARYWAETGAGSEQLGRTAAWYGEQSWIPFILVPATFLLLLFPDGHLLSVRWRPVAWLAGAGVAAAFVAGGLTPGPLEDYPGIENPYGVDSPAVDAGIALALVTVLAGLVGSAASAVLRFRRARGEQRQQMKWIAFAGAGAAVTIPLVFSVYDVIGQPVADSAIMVSILMLPTATALAIVRYRLYDIDVVINRTLVYGSLTVTLAAVYVGSVLLLQLLLSGLTKDSGLAVAASTLAVAALFRPVRGRIQKIVDRRFFRSRYDARRTIETFGARLRDEVDLFALSTDLQAVVADTMQPAHVSLWLRSGGPA